MEILKMKTGISLIALCVLTIFAFTLYAHADGNIGVNYSQVADDVSAGVLAGYNYESGKVDFEVDAQLNIGDIYRNDAKAEVVFDVGLVGIKFITEITGKGYTLETMGRETNLRAALSFPTGSLNFDVGVGGQNASPWADPNVVDILTDAGADINDAEDFVEGRTIAFSTGLLPAREGNSAHIYVSTGFEKSNIDVDLKGVFDIFSEGDKANQLIGDFSTSRKFGVFEVRLGYQIAVMAYQEDIFHESAASLFLGYKF